ncbi:unnamed protein product [Soboliphyme baturini]|uniref:Integrase catalytic domain-containing protein n=1 Tax=Soboliphyme baturini TaxID=241478 RepID=A0A183J9F3_9BILA|nr:unnamed protein product [Soboliphyme baturini]
MKAALKKQLGHKEPSTRVRYIETHKTAAIAVAKAKTDSSEKFGEVLESNFPMANEVCWQTIGQLQDEMKGALRVLQGTSEHPLTKDYDILRPWREYYEERFNPALPQENSPVEQKSTDITISEDEITQAVKSLKNRKAAGIDEIRPEMLKALGEQGMCWLTRD